MKEAKCFFLGSKSAKESTFYFLGFFVELFFAGVFFVAFFFAGVTVLGVAVFLLLKSSERKLFTSLGQSSLMISPSVHSGFPMLY